MDICSKAGWYARLARCLVVEYNAGLMDWYFQLDAEFSMGQFVQPRINQGLDIIIKWNTSILHPEQGALAGSWLTFQQATVI